MGKSLEQFFCWGLITMKQKKSSIVNIMFLRHLIVPKIVKKVTAMVKHSIQMHKKQKKLWIGCFWEIRASKVKTGKIVARDHHKNIVGLWLFPFLKCSKIKIICISRLDISLESRQLKSAKQTDFATSSTLQSSSRNTGDVVKPFPFAAEKWSRLFFFSRWFEWDWLERNTSKLWGSKNWRQQPWLCRNFGALKWQGLCSGKALPDVHWLVPQTLISSFQL